MCFSFKEREREIDRFVKYLLCMQIVFMDLHVIIYKKRKITFGFSFLKEVYCSPTVPILKDAVSLRLLQKEKAHIHRLLEPFKGRWKESGVTTVSDGWGHLKSRPIVNFFAMADGLPTFPKFVDCSSEIIDKFFNANSIKEVINEVGHENVVQVITDNALDCKDAGELIEAQFPNISWSHVWSTHSILPWRLFAMQRKSKISNQHGM